MQSLLDVVTGLQSYSKVSLFVLYVCITCFQKTAWSAQVTCSFLKRHSTLFLSMYLKLYCGDIFVRNDCVSAPLVLILTIIVFSELQLTSWMLFTNGHLSWPRFQAPYYSINLYVLLITTSFIFIFFSNRNMRLETKETLRVLRYKTFLTLYNFWYPFTKFYNKNNVCQFLWEKSIICIDKKL